MSKKCNGNNSMKLTLISIRGKIAMIYKRIFVIILIVIAVCSSEQLKPKTLPFVYKYKEYFKANYELPDSISKLSYEEWKEKSSEIISNVVYSTMRQYSKDSLYLQLLISVIDLPDSRPLEDRVFKWYDLRARDTLDWSRDGVAFLINKTAFPVLRRYSKLIKAKLKNSKIPEKIKLPLLTLLDLSDNEKQQILTRINQLENPSREDSLKNELEKDNAFLLNFSNTRKAEAITEKKTLLKVHNPTST